MTEEEYFRKAYPDYCYGERPLSPYWDLFQDGVEFGERQSAKKIEELETRCTELFLQNNEFAERFEKSIGIIKGLLSCCRNYPQENAEKVKQAEQFLMEIEK